MCLRREVPRPVRRRLEGPPKEGADLASIVLTVPVPKDGNFKDAKERDKLDYQTHIVGKCRAAGLDVRGFYGLQAPDGSQSVFLQVSASLERLLTEADRIKMPLQLDPWELESADETINRFIVDHVDPGFFSSADGGGDSEHLDVRIPTKSKAWSFMPCLSSTPLNAYDRIWAPFVSDSKLRRLYAVQDHTNCILTEVQALKLLRSVMEARADTDAGAGLDLDELQGKGHISRWFPGHSDRAKAELMRQWGGCRMPWNAPVGRVKEYMGEKVAYYFLFLGHAAKWLVIPALVGLGIFIDQVLHKEPNTVYLPAYGVLVGIWATFFMESWKRRQSSYEQKFGMNATSHAGEELRPEFTQKASKIRSFVTGKPTYATNPASSRCRRFFSGTITMTLLGIVVVVIGSIFWVRVLLVDQSKSRGGKLPDFLPEYLTSAINAVQIQIMSAVYSWLARRMTDFENHETQNGYESSLTLKLAIFQSINSYFSLVYIAAIKNVIVINGQQQHCTVNSRTGEPDCLGELQSQLATLIILKVLMGLFFQFLMPLIFRCLRRAYMRCWYRKTPAAQQLYDSWRKARKVSPLERDASRPPYDPFDDYLEVFLLVGYSTLFVVAFPLAPIIVFLALLVNMYVDRNRILTHSSRPMPQSARNIGAWQLAFEVLSYVTVVTTACIVIFTNQGPIFGMNFNPQQRLIFFIVAEHVVFVIKYGISAFIPDQTQTTLLQLDRQKYLVQKHIFGLFDVPLTDSLRSRWHRFKRGAQARLDGLAPTADGDDDRDRPDDGAGGAGGRAPGARSGGGCGATSPGVGAGAGGGAGGTISLAPSYFLMSGVEDPRKGDGIIIDAQGRVVKDASGAALAFSVENKMRASAGPSGSPGSVASGASSSSAPGPAIIAVSASASSAGAAQSPDGIAMTAYGGGGGGGSGSDMPTSAVPVPLPSTAGSPPAAYGAYAADGSVVSAAAAGGMGAYMQQQQQQQQGGAYPTLPAPAAYGYAAGSGV